MLNGLGTQAIETDRILLRQMQIIDAEDMFNNWASDPDVSKFYTWEPHENRLQTQHLISGWVAEYDNPLYFHWIVIDKEMRKAIGTFYISDIDEENGAGVINCILSQQVWGKGVATEITQAVISYCFQKVNFKKILAHHHENNIASGRALAKSGLHFVGKSCHTYENPSINGNYLHYEIENSTEK